MVFHRFTTVLICSKGTSGREHISINEWSSPKGSSERRHRIANKVPASKRGGSSRLPSCLVDQQYARRTSRRPERPLGRLAPAAMQCEADNWRTWLTSMWFTTLMRPP